jgi:ribonucleotide monophosphatase NagD (HAD superfamily)
MGLLVQLWGAPAFLQSRYSYTSRIKAQYGCAAFTFGYEGLENHVKKVGYRRVEAEGSRALIPGPRPEAPSFNSLQW